MTTPPTTTTTQVPARPAPRSSHGSIHGSEVDAIGVGRTAGRRDVLRDVTLAVRPGELLALMGPSGAGKTTLLELLAGVRTPSSGRVTHDGLPVGGADGSGRAVGYVPQDDIVHADLPLRRTLRYAARLRRGPGSPAPDPLVDAVLDDLGLAHRGDVPVKRLSGGQRKRASIAVELLAGPGTLFLDEPTSGLDPATSADVLRLLRRLADDGTTVVLTTHSTADAELCDTVVLLDRAGRVAFTGPPDAAAGWFGVTGLAEVFAVLASDTGSAPPVQPAGQRAAPDPTEPAAPPAASPAAAGRQGGSAARARRRTSGARQALLLTRRNAETLVRSPLTLAVLVGSPVLVTVMLAMLFRPAVGAGVRGEEGLAQVAFWTAFSGFFFGLTYGLLQIVPELAILRREHRAGVGAGPYVVAKMLVLLPVLALVTAVMLGVLRGLDRIPAAGAPGYASLFGVLLVEEAAALALGLLASASVSTASQAALALPMLCFPQVLFAGGVVPTDDMAVSGRLLSRLLANRYGFEAVGIDLRRAVHAEDAGAAGSVGGSWAALFALTVAASLATVAVVRRRATSPGRR